ncbi:MAG: RIP metalloprotease RseP [Alphaproteobacteria bacterium]|nr:RIP metalloprotease RseP [Alphaproteobacteria bacterium]MBQ9234860.1 RIP metalloprotease RseP [Alphaproteobacteria bacterium]
MSWLINILYYVVPFLVLLGVLVFVHEFGHYLIAKLCGVKVAEFSIGFGRTLWGQRDASGTLWKLSAIPLGGYCRFLGDGDASSSTDAQEELSPEEQKYAFANQNPYKKLAIVIGGPAFNYLFAILVFFLIFATLGKMDFPPIIGEVMPDSAAQAAGIASGDRVLSVDGVKVNSFQQFRLEIDMNTTGVVQLELQRGDELLHKKVHLKPVTDKDGNITEKPMVGVTSVNVVEFDRTAMSLWGAAKESVAETWRITATTLRGVYQMVTGARGTEELGGIVRIAEMSGDISKSNSIVDFLVFMALLSINLGLINLFPIPVLDGGHVVIFTIEILLRREINEKAKEYVFKFGFALLIALMFFATYNDITHLIKRAFS